MKKYEKPEMTVKSLTQTAGLAAGEEAQVSIPQSWWPED